MFNKKINFNQNRSLKNGMPNMYNTLTGWEVPLTLVKITQSVEEGDVVKTEEEVNFLGEQLWQSIGRKPKLRKWLLR